MPIARFLIDNVADYWIANGGWTNPLRIEDFPNAAPPFDQFFMEHRVHGKDGRTPARDDVNIVTALLDAGAPVADATLADAYNKVKHRFTVVDDMKSLGIALSVSGRQAAYVRYPREPAKADVLYANVMTVAAAGGEVAALVTWLDELGLLPPSA